MIATLDTAQLAPFLGPAVALGAGLLIGIERERSKGSGPHRGFAGVRTFALVALAGSLAQAVDSVALVAAGALLVAMLSAIAYWRDRSADPGVTTEWALFVTYVVGVAAVPAPALAAAAGVLVAGLLAARNHLHRFSRDLLTARELRDGLILAGAALVVLPVLPDSSPDWAPALNAYRVWSLVVAILLLQGLGHVAARLLGARRGLAWSGFFSGFVSSTATIGALGLRAKAHPTLLDACAAGALLSTVATFVQLALIAMLVDPKLMAALAIPLGAAGTAAVGIALVAVARSPRRADGPSPDRHAFGLGHALGFALLMTGVTAAVSFAAKQGFASAAWAGIALGGFADAHAAASAAFSLSIASPEKFDAAMLMLLGVSTNTLSKCAVAAVAGGGAYARRVVPALLGVAGAGWLGWWLAG